MSALDPLIAALRDARKSGDTAQTRLATVTSISAGAVFVRFDGETVASARAYKRVTTYAPAAGARVLMTRVGSTWVVSGEVGDGLWVAFAPNYPNVPMTNVKSEYQRIGDTVTVRSVITLTGAIGPALIDVPLPFASDVYIGSGDINLLGRVRAIRNGVAWFIGDICAYQLASPSRAAIWLSTGPGTQWSATNPGTWASGDRWAFDYTYKTAS